MEQNEIKCYLMWFYDPKSGKYFTKVYKLLSSVERARKKWWFTKRVIIEEWRNPEMVKQNNLDIFPSIIEREP